MKKILLTGVGLAVFGMGSALAADLPHQMPAKAPAYVAPAAYNWTGPYIGINGGYAWGGGKDGGLVGGTLGYNYQTGPWVFGLEGDWDWTNIKGSTACAAGTCTVKNHWLATARGRLGYAMGTNGNILPYVTGGAAFGDIENSVSGVGTVSDTSAGWTVGAGLEAAISGPLTAKIEYLYVDLDNGPTLAGQGSNLQSNIVRAGLNYRF
ncbi:MAG: porin family protein [Pseudolabrys sp.]|nr:porin family protein [Pseudolabrys sp.]